MGAVSSQRFFSQSAGGGVVQKMLKASSKVSSFALERVAGILILVMEVTS